MYGGGAKRVRFKKNKMRVKFKICFKFGLKIKKIHGSARPRPQSTPVSGGKARGAQTRRIFVPGLFSAA
jgi:hypothetical protein